jgi:ankyrin repeat protein
MALMEAYLRQHTATAEHNKTALIWAYRNGHTAIVELLIAEEADMEAKDNVRQG